MQYVTELINILNAMSPYLLLGFFIAGVLHVYLPQTSLTKHLSKRGFKSVLLSAIIGIPLPLCSCGVIPTAMSLKKEGASDGATVSFLTATPQTGIDSILATYGVMGLPFAIIRPIVALIVALFGGVLVDAFSTNTPTAPHTTSTTNCNIKRAGIIEAIRYGFVEMIQDLGKWLSVGLLIAAAITVFVPDSVFELFHDHYILNILVVLLLSIPMYICSTGSIPIAVSLLIKGISPGAALVFLMAGPATNVATLAVVRKVLGAKTTALYLLSIILGAIGFAYIIDFALPPQWFTLNELLTNGETEQCCGKWWQIASSVLFIALLINGYISKLRGGGHNHIDVMNSNDNKKVIKVIGMRCNHCKANVERAIGSLPGVTKVVADITTDSVEIEGDVSIEMAAEAARQLGFEVNISSEI